MVKRRVVVVGGGFTGASAAVQLVRNAPFPVEVALVEPRADLGRGVAYSSADPDHRLNGPLDLHYVDPARPDAVQRWCNANGVLTRDPEAVAANGAIFIRRSDFGAHVGAMVTEHGPAILHLRARATSIRSRGSLEEVALDDGTVLPAELVVLATGNGSARLPPALAALAGQSAIIANPFEHALLPIIAPDARVLVVGSSLTALDVISTLLRREHAGPITVLSRHGLRPTEQKPRTGEADISALVARIEGPIPEFVAQRHTLRELVKATRRQIDTRRGVDPSWHAAFDEVRNSVWRLWPALPLAEKQRFLRHFRHWYDVFRFRSPPQNEAMVRDAEAHGLVKFVASREIAATGFDIVVNCTGLDPDCGASDNPLLAGLLEQDRIVRHETGFGFAVDGDCRPLGRDGLPNASLRMLGPPTAGTFGDPLGVPFIAPQIRRVLPSLLRAAAAG